MAVEKKIELYSTTTAHVFWRTVCANINVGTCTSLTIGGLRAYASIKYGLLRAVWIDHVMCSTKGFVGKSQGFLTTLPQTKRTHVSES